MVRTTARLTIVMLAILIVLVVPNVSNLAQDTPTPTAIFQPQSLFAGDPCAPPCWFGLVAGESTAADVEQMLVEFDEVLRGRIDESETNQIDLVTSYLTEGVYSVYWRRPYNPFPNGIIIRDGIVDEMGFYANQDVRLRDVIRLLGQPDQVYFHNPQISDFQLFLIYTNYKMWLWMDERSGSQRCLIGNIRIHFRLVWVSYFSDTALEALLDEYPSELSYLREVPADVWQSWLNGEVGDYCWDAWEHLPPPEATPIPEATAEPEATLQP